jgi:outer membrane protein assembly factor BamE (lipoprotein component of BamABCDE complex)
MKKTSHDVIIVALMALLLGGCTIIQGTVGEPFSPEAVQAIQDGRTTKQEVVGKLGTPSIISIPSPGRERYVYHFNQLEGSGFIGFTVQDNARFLEIIFRGDVVESQQYVVPIAGGR